MRVDHLVWYCADLAEGERYFADRMNCASAYGGVHPGEGTRNSLLSLAEMTYVEILARDPAQAPTCLDTELQALAKSGLYHWAVGRPDIDTLRRDCKAAGLDGSDIVTGGRTRPDGKSLAWKVFGVRNHGFGALVPFFIDWTNSEHPAKTAPRGGTLTSLQVWSPEPEKLREFYRLLGLDIEVAQAVSPGLSATVESRSGRHELRMLDPIPRGFVI